MRFYVSSAKVVDGEIEVEIQFEHSFARGTVRITERRIQLEGSPDDVKRAESEIIARLVSAIHEHGVRSMEENAEVIRGKTFWAA